MVNWDGILSGRVLHPLQPCALALQHTIYYGQLEIFYALQTDSTSMLNLRLSSGWQSLFEKLWTGHGDILDRVWTHHRQSVDCILIHVKLYHNISCDDVISRPSEFRQ